MQTLEQWAAVFTIFGFPALLISLFFASRLDRRISVQLSELKRIAQSQNTIALNTMMFNNPINIAIISAIEADEPILKEHKGTLLSAQLDKYLNNFETLAMVYHEGLLTKDQLDEHFSEYIEQLGRNREVAEYLKRYPDYFGGLRTLFKLYAPTAENYKPPQAER